MDKSYVSCNPSSLQFCDKTWKSVKQKVSISQTFSHFLTLPISIRGVYKMTGKENITWLWFAWLLRCTELPDDPKVQWPEEVVTESVLQHIENFKIDAVVTFDKHGVSKHKNHVSLFYAIASLCIERRVPPCECCTILDSTA